MGDSESPSGTEVCGGEKLEEGKIEGSKVGVKSMSLPVSGFNSNSSLCPTSSTEFRIGKGGSKSIVEAANFGLQKTGSSWICAGGIAAFESQMP